MDRGSEAEQGGEVEIELAGSLFKRLNIFQSSEVTVVNTTNLNVVVCLAMDPNAVRTSSVSLGLGGGGSGMQGNIDVQLDNKIAGPVQKQGVASGGGRTVLRLDGSKGYLTIFAAASTGGYYLLLVSNRLVNAHDTFTVQPQHLLQPLGKVVRL